MNFISFKVFLIQTLILMNSWEFEWNPGKKRIKGSCFAASEQRQTAHRKPSAGYFFFCAFWKRPNSHPPIAHHFCTACWRQDTHKQRSISGNNVQHKPQRLFRDAKTRVARHTATQCPAPQDGLAPGDRWRWGITMQNAPKRWRRPTILRGGYLPGCSARGSEPWPRCSCWGGSRPRTVRKGQPQRPSGKRKKNMGNIVIIRNFLCPPKQHTAKKI